MTIIWSGRDVTFQRAGIGQVTDVLSVLNEAASWLHAWHRSVACALRGGLGGAGHRAGETWLVLIGGDIAATLTLDWSDMIWSDIPGTAGFLHRMAVRRWAAGLGGVLLRWAADATLAHGRSALRLDCVASNGWLRAYYEAAGFVHCGNVMVGGAPGQRLDEGPVTLVSRVSAAFTIDSLASGSCEGARSLAPYMTRLRPAASVEAKLAENAGRVPPASHNHTPGAAA